MERECTSDSERLSFGLSTMPISNHVHFSVFLNLFTSASVSFSLKRDDYIPSGSLEVPSTMFSRKKKKSNPWMAVFLPSPHKKMSHHRGFKSSLPRMTLLVNVRSVCTLCIRPCRYRVCYLEARLPLMEHRWIWRTYKSRKRPCGHTSMETLSSPYPCRSFSVI